LVKRFNITKEGFKNIRGAVRWNLFLREFEIDKILGGFPKEFFDEALELGCGSGSGSKYLAFYCKKLIAMEYNADRLTECNDEKITFLIGDAQNLPQFADGEMDLIFSSNFIEHLPNLDKCLAECRRVVKQDGRIIHTVPNRTWKFFHLLLYYPFGIKVVLWRLFSKNKSTVLSELLGEEINVDSNLRPVSGSLRSNLLPKTHGISKSHIREFMDWAEKRWLEKFERNGLEVVEIIRLPFYFGWGDSFRFILKLGNYLGLSSSTAFVLRKIVDR
jgi:ubiquinone/menaquinone biosynthesis C-methylase UbiE